MENEMTAKMEQEYIEERGEEIFKIVKRQKVEQEVISLINDIAPTEVKEKSNLLQNDLGVDSLGLIMLLTMIEDTFEIELDESDMNPFALQTVQDVIDLVAKYADGQKEESDE